VFIEAKDDGGGGDNWITRAISRANLQSFITTNKPHPTGHSNSQYTPLHQSVKYDHK